MWVLLDENVPRALTRSLAPQYEARTVKQQGWAGRKNGDLLQIASEYFDAFLTTDKGIRTSRASSATTSVSCCSKRVATASRIWTRWFRR